MQATAVAPRRRPTASRSSTRRTCVGRLPSVATADGPRIRSVAHRAGRARRPASVTRRRRRRSSTCSLADAALELGGGAGRRPPGRSSSNAIRSASRSASSRYCVVSRIGRCPSADQLADHVPHGLPAARVEPGGRLVQEDHRGPADQAHGEVEPAAHAAGVGLDQPPARRRSGRTAPAARRPGGAAARRAAGRSRPISSRFSSPVSSSSTAAYCPVRLIDRRTRPGVADHVVAGDAWPCPASGGTSVDEDPDDGGLAGAVGPEQREHRAARRRRRSTPSST